MGKRKKRSGLPGIQLAQLLEMMEKTKEDILLARIMNGQSEVEEELEPGLVESQPKFEELIDRSIAFLKTHMSTNVNLTFSELTEDHLTLFRLKGEKILKLKPNLGAQVDAAKQVGSVAAWSADHLVRHLGLLLERVASPMEASARVWIDPFFFRACAMMPPDKKMALSLEQVVPHTVVSLDGKTTFGGYIDYAAHTVNAQDFDDFRDNFLAFASLSGIKMYDHAIFISEAKAKAATLQNSVPQAVGEIYAIMKTLGKPTMRGVLTNGEKWIFILLKVAAEGHGASYWISKELTVTYIDINDQATSISANAVALISGILTHWILYSHEAITDDDWFEKEQ
ncbi:hypothetical protein B0H34DRAFT_709530 [Crassisporium funariophilum]|nr:hypothetical protein B0H34DRAFT_709530 [Crassisporium funariophilum]